MKRFTRMAVLALALSLGVTVSATTLDNVANQASLATVVTSNQDVDAEPVDESRPTDVVLLKAHDPCADHSDWNWKVFSTSMFHGAFYYRVYEVGESMDICTTAHADKKPKGYKFTIKIYKPGADVAKSSKTKRRLTVGAVVQSGQCGVAKITLQYTNPARPGGKGRSVKRIDFCVDPDDSPSI